MFLQSGKYYSCRNGLTVRHPRIGEIEEIGEERYDSVLSLFCSDAYHFMVELDDLGIDYQQVKEYELFLMMFNPNDSKEDLDWLFMGDFNFGLCFESEDKAYLYDPINDIFLDESDFFEIREFLQRINFMGNEKKDNPGNEETKKMLIEEKRRKKKRQKNKPKKDDSQLANNISFLVWNNTNGLKYEDVFELFIFRFFEGVKRLLKTDNYKNKMLGYYTGNIDASKIKFEDIDWTGKLT